jgi:hypothetical protein
MVAPNSQDPEVRARVAAIKSRMIRDLATHLPPDWIENADATDRTDFLQKMHESKTIIEIVDICSWTMLCIEVEEKARARPEE